VSLFANFAPASAESYKHETISVFTLTVRVYLCKKLNVSFKSTVLYYGSKSR